MKYPLDAYAMGPFRYAEPVSAQHVSQNASRLFGGPPAEIWPTGPAEEVSEYEYEVAECT